MCVDKESATICYVRGGKGNPKLLAWDTSISDLFETENYYHRVPITVKGAGKIIRRGEAGF